MKWMIDSATDGVMNRRRFLSALAATAGALAAVLLAMPVLGFVIGPVLRRRNLDWRAVGPVEKFIRGTTVKVVFKGANEQPWAGDTGRKAAWLRCSGDGTFTAFALECTHLGCPVRWNARAELFMCPCHGGVYYADGRVAGGPPPRPLSRYPVRVRGGHVEIRTEPLPIT
jgi:menaquinol-cytochrome c reductase iron-sulfur subunit